VPKVLRWGARTMKETALVAMMAVAVSCPSLAKTLHHHHLPPTATSHSHITCEMVRAYVAQIGLVQAKAMAQTSGLTEIEKRQAMQCLRESKT
ncbi:MAG: hypothetical protein WA652_02580, partial [Xanthobacteraceae bacterium]